MPSRECRELMAFLSKRIYCKLAMEESYAGVLLRTCESVKERDGCPKLDVEKSCFNCGRYFGPVVPISYAWCQKYENLKKANRYCLSPKNRFKFWKLLKD